MRNVNQAIEKKVIEYGKIIGVDFYKVFVIDHNSTIELYIFFTTDSEVISFENSEKHNEKIAQMVSSIIGNQYEILIYFDSDENVKKNYQGNYYYRLL